MHFDVGEKRFDLRVGQFFAPSMRVEEPMLSTVATLRKGVQPIWRQSLEGVPTPLELIDFRDEFDQVLADGECWFLHGDWTGISDFIPDYTQLYPI